MTAVLSASPAAQGTLYELAVVQGEQWGIGAAMQTAADEAERMSLFDRFTATLPHTDRLRRALEHTAKAALSAPPPC